MLKELGWVEGQSLVIEQRYGRGSAARYAELAAELVRLRVDVLVTDGSATTRAAQRATSTIPVVFLVGDATLATFPAHDTPRYATTAAVSLAALDLFITQVSWVRPLSPVR